MAEDYCVEENKHKCEGCIYCIVGERMDKRGYVMKTQACLCEAEMCASCAPEYQFLPYHIYEGKMTVRDGKLHFIHNGKLKLNISFNSHPEKIEKKYDET